MNWKETYTKIFLKQSDIAVSDANIKQYMSDWWQNTRGKTEGGLRLTEDGFDFLQENLDIQMYEIPFPRDFKFTTQTYIFLDQFITCPYYLTNRSIWVTDEKKSMELHLFSGDLRKYGLTKAMKRHE
tara:strand:+ start:3516 stop:3896 length:381 start_codon:yes stop_codon:yes gene_type:complete